MQRLLIDKAFYLHFIIVNYVPRTFYSEQRVLRMQSHYFSTKELICVIVEEVVIYVATNFYTELEKSRAF